MNKVIACLPKLIVYLWKGDKPEYLPMIVIVSVIWLVGFLIGMHAPIDVLSKQQILQQYVASVSFIANPQGFMGVKSNFPEVSLLYHAVVCWSQPLWFLLSWKWLNKQINVDKTGLIYSTGIVKKFHKLKENSSSRLEILKCAVGNSDKSGKPVLSPNFTVLGAHFGRK